MSFLEKKPHHHHHHLTPLTLASFFHPADLSLSLTSSERSSLVFPGAQHPMMFPTLLLLLVKNTHPSALPQLQFCEMKAKGGLGNPRAPSMYPVYPRWPVNVEGIRQF